MGVRELYAFIWGVTAWRGMRVKAIRWHLRGLDECVFCNLMESYREATARERLEFYTDPDIREVLDNFIQGANVDMDVDMDVDV